MFGRKGDAFAVTRTPQPLYLSQVSSFSQMNKMMKFIVHEGNVVCGCLRALWCICIVSADDDNDGRLSTVVHHLQFRTVIPNQPHKNQSFTIINIVYVYAAAKCSMMVWYPCIWSPFTLPQRRTPNTCSTYMLAELNRLFEHSVQKHVCIYMYKWDCREHYTFHAHTTHTNSTSLLYT